MFRELGDAMAEYLSAIGINPIYFVTVMMLLISLSYVKYLKTWDEEHISRKSAIILTLSGTIMMIFFSIASLLGLGGFGTE